MQDQHPLILITNDDGVEAPGLRRLIETAAPLGEVVAVAPARPHSGMSSAISVNAPLFVREHAGHAGARICSVTGSPVDCVKLALDSLLPRRPDLLLSGINHGSNSGNSVIYSGTMGAAAEGCMAGIPSVGFSLTHHSLKADFGPGLPFVDKITRAVLLGGLPEGVCLNVNIPSRCEPAGMKVVRAARGHWTEEYRRYETPYGEPFYWLTGRFANSEPDCDETDEYWLARDMVTVVPFMPQQAVEPDVASAVAAILSL